MASTSQTLKIYRMHAKKYPLPLCVMVAGIVISPVNDMVRPWLYKWLIDSLTDFHLNDSLHWVCLIFLLGVFHVGLWRGVDFFTAKFQARTMSDLLNTCYAYILDHSYAFYCRNYSGSIVAKINRYPRAFENITDRICWDFIAAALRMMIAIPVLFLLSWKLGVVMVIWISIYVSFSLLFARYKLPYDMAKSAHDSVITGHLGDSITNQLTIKLFASQQIEVKIFNSLTDTLYSLRRKSWNLSIIAELFQGVSMITLEYIFFRIALVNYENHTMTSGDFMLLYAYLRQIFDRLWDIGRNIRSVYESLGDAEEMTNMLLLPHEVVDESDAKDLVVTEGKIEFRNVSFSYKNGENCVLENFNLIINPGEKVGIVGPSGNGKSTTIKSLLRLFDIQNGTILIDGQDIKKVKMDSLRKQIVQQPQEAILFGRSIYENIAYSKPDASEEEVMRAAYLAHCEEFVNNLEEKYQTKVGERGVTLSGGERQRVRLACSILSDAPIVILDEATSSLDSESEMYIQQSIRETMSEKTMIVIAHRLSTIRHMDRIVVMGKGGIIEEGTHEQLMKNPRGLYKRLWDIQAEGFVLSRS